MPRVPRGQRAEVGRLKLPKLRLDAAIRLDEPLAKRTTLKVGGSADVWAEVGTVGDLARLLKWARKSRTPFHLLGAGSNVVISDLGVRGIVARLVGPDFAEIREERGGIRVGAGVPLARLVDWMEKRGMGGYEFLDGIPGTAGGAVRMNAGASGQEIGPLVAAVRCLDGDGSLRMIDGKALGFEYRRCRSLESRIAADVLLKKGEAVDAGTIQRRRREIAGKRAWWRGLRCAGSVFKNPPGDFAGRLIEQAGLKGLRVGRASVSRQHANVIVTDDGALASDVRCLVETIRSEVEQRCGARLEAEVLFLE